MAAVAGSDSLCYLIACCNVDTARQSTPFRAKRMQFTALIFYGTGLVKHPFGCLKRILN